MIACGPSGALQFGKWEGSCLRASRGVGFFLDREEEVAGVGARDPLAAPVHTVEGFLWERRRQ